MAFNFDENVDEGSDDFDASVDILVGLVGVVLIVVMLIIPFVDFSMKRQAVLDVVKSDIRLPQNLTLDGVVVDPIIASEDGLTLVSKKSVQIGLDEILDSSRLASELQKLQKRKIQPIVFIEQLGQESVFLLETVLVKYDVETFGRIYLDDACNFFKPQARPVDCGQSSNE